MIAKADGGAEREVDVISAAVGGVERAADGIDAELAAFVVGGIWSSSRLKPEAAISIVGQKHRQRLRVAVGNRDFGFLIDVGQEARVLVSTVFLDEVFDLFFE